MADEITTDRPKLGDSTNTLLIKLATALQSKAAITADGNIERERAKFGDSDNTLLLKAAHAAQHLP